MRTEIKKVEEGDFIIVPFGHLKEMKIQVKTIISQDFWGERNEENPGRDWGYYLEFLDGNGNYHYWKQQHDGGRLVKKEAEQ